MVRLKLLPYDTFTVQTRSPLAAVVERLSARVEPRKLVRFPHHRNHLPYQGEVTDIGFSISRIIHYRNSFLPNIEGRFENHASGTLVKITLSIHPLVGIFIGFWSLAVSGYKVWFKRLI